MHPRVASLDFEPLLTVVGYAGTEVLDRVRDRIRGTRLPVGHGERTSDTYGIGQAPEEFENRLSAVTSERARSFSKDHVERVADLGTFFSLCEALRSSECRD